MKDRLQSVDALRGLIMIVMTLDHTRDFFHVYATVFRPEDLARTTTAIFLTRWITHVCAPVFMFTAGVGAFFWLQREGRTKAQLSGFLLKRGLWLALLDVMVIQFLVTFGPGPSILTPLWGLGWAMVFLAVMIYIPVVPLAFLSVGVIASHNLLDPVTSSQLGNYAWVWNCLHQIGIFQVAGRQVLITYPLAPWFAVMAAGYCFGTVLLFDTEKRRAWLWRIGAATTVAFVVIRAINVYGDPVPWSGGVLSFLRCNKYPPSLDFLLMTLGPAILMLGWFDRFEFSRMNPMIVFGRVPLFYFILHLSVLHLLALATGRNGYSLGIVYLLWIAVVAALYPLCLWFARLKQRRSEWWVSYF